MYSGLGKRHVIARGQHEGREASASHHGGAAFFPSCFWQKAGGTGQVSSWFQSHIGTVESVISIEELNILLWALIWLLNVCFVSYRDPESWGTQFPLQVPHCRSVSTVAVWFIRWLRFQPSLTNRNKLYKKSLFCWSSFFIKILRLCFRCG